MGREPALISAHDAVAVRVITEGLAERHVQVAVLAVAVVALVVANHGQPRAVREGGLRGRHEASATHRRLWASFR